MSKRTGCAGWRPIVQCTLALFALCTLTACAQLPVIEPGGQLVPARAVQLEGRRGPMSAEQSKALLDRMDLRGPQTGIFERHLAVEEALVGSPLTTGNRVLLLKDGPATYRAMFAAIEAARDHINLETYILDDDEVGRRFAEALTAKQAKGVQVNIIRDSVGTIGTPEEFFQRLQDSGIRVLEFNPINPLAARKSWELNQRGHRKLLVVDGRTAFLGGINISGVYSSGSFSRGSKAKAGPDGEPGPAWRDTHLQITGPVVAEFQKLFLAAWEDQQGDPLPQREYFPPNPPVGRDVVRAIGSSPEEAYSPIYATLLSAIGSAETRIQITNAYFVPDPQLLAALEAAARRGVDVRLILPSQTDASLVFHAGRSFYERLLRAGVKIFERGGVILHSKSVVIDGVWATIGSTNLDWRSFLHNYELNAVVLGTDFGALMQMMFEEDLAASEEITLAQWRKRPLHFRVKEIFSRAWEYWL